MCSMTRYFMIFAIVATLATMETASQPIGWAVGAVATGLAYALRERVAWLSGGSCALPERSTTTASERATAPAHDHEGTTSAAPGDRRQG